MKPAHLRYLLLPCMLLLVAKAALADDYHFPPNQITCKTSDDRSTTRCSGYNGGELMLTSAYPQKSGETVYNFAQGLSNGTASVQYIYTPAGATDKKYFIHLQTQPGEYYYNQPLPGQTSTFWQNCTSDGCQCAPPASNCPYTNFYQLKQ